MSFDFDRNWTKVVVRGFQSIPSDDEGSMLYAPRLSSRSKENVNLIAYVVPTLPYVLGMFDGPLDPRMPMTDSSHMVSLRKKD